ncbi:beta-propeller fold lactonase family protein [bacterium]|nr:beta-propeller fold lactonase family protein [bacterium]
MRSIRWMLVIAMSAAAVAWIGCTFDDETYFLYPLYLNEPSNPTRTSLELTWSITPAEETFAHYRLYYSEVSRFDTSSTSYYVDSVRTNTSRTVRGLEPGGTYYFRVYTELTSGEVSEASNEVHGTTLVWGVTDTFELGLAPTDVEVSRVKFLPPRDERVFIAHYESDKVSVVSVTGDTLMGEVTGLSQPWALKAEPDAEFIHIAAPGDEKVWRVKMEDFTIDRDYDVGSNPMDIDFTPNGVYAWVTEMEDSSVTIINTVLHETLNIDIGKSAKGIAILPYGNKAYITNMIESQVTAVNTANNEVITSINVEAGPQGVKASADGRWVYVANANTDIVSVINTEIDEVVGWVRVGDKPVDMALSPDGYLMYVVNYDSDNMTVIHLGTNTVAGTIPVGDGPLSIDITEEGEFAYVANYLGNNVMKVALQP